MRALPRRDPRAEGPESRTEQRARGTSRAEAGQTSNNMAAGFSTADSAPPGGAASAAGPRRAPRVTALPARDPSGRTAAPPRSAGRGGCAAPRPGDSESFGSRLPAQPLLGATRSASPLRPRIALRAAGFSRRSNKTLPRGYKAEKEEEQMA